MGLKIRSMEFDNKGKLIKVKGTFSKNNKIFFSKITDKIIYWAELELEYSGG